MKRTRKNITVNILLPIILMILVSARMFGQEQKNRDAIKIFYRIEEGISGRAVDKFSNYFSNKNFLSLSSGNSGYYSSNQSFYVIKDYLSIYQPLTFKLDNIVTDSSTPFASGILKYSSKGIRGTATVFISLQFEENQWRISQITIN
jgi:hypothetical protein